MGLTLWKKRDSYNNEANTFASKDDPLPVAPFLTDEDDPLPVLVSNTVQPPIAGQTITRVVQVPGIGTGSAYQTGDAFGTLITFPDVFRPEKGSGIVVKVLFYDLDDEGIQKDLILFSDVVTTTADNSPIALPDSLIQSIKGGITISTFFDLLDNQVGQWTGTLWVQGTGPNLYALAITRGADNVAAGSVPLIALTTVPD